MDAWKNNEWAFVLCCCGGVPVFGAIKGALLIAPVLLVLTLGVTGITIMLIPYDIVATYYTLVCTDTIGPNLKVLGFLLLPVPIVLSIPAAFLASLLISIGLGFFYPFGMTFQSYCAGWDALPFAFTGVGMYWDRHYRSYFSYLSELRNPHDKAPWDINLCQVFVGLFIAAVGSVVVGICVTILAILKLIPAILRGWYLLFKEFCGCHEVLLYCACSPFWLVAVAAWPAVAAIGCVLCWVGGFSVGAYCAVVAYQDGVRAGFESMYLFVRDFDAASNQHLGGSGSCFPEITVTKRKSKPNISDTLFERNQDPQSNVSKLARAEEDPNRVPAEQLCDYFFAQAPLLLAAAVRGELITTEALKRMDSKRRAACAASVVYFDVLDRSASLMAEIFLMLRDVVSSGPDGIVLDYLGGIHTLVLADGLSLDETNRPFGLVFYPLFTSAIPLCTALTHLKMNAKSASTSNALVKYIQLQILDEHPATVTFTRTELQTCKDIADKCKSVGVQSVSPLVFRRLDHCLKQFMTEDIV